MTELVPLRRNHTALLIIDMQDRLLPSIDGCGAITEAAGLLVRASAVFGLPALVTEQYPKGIGHTVDVLAEPLDALGAQRLAKTTFSCCGDATVMQQLHALDRTQIVVAGVEAHVCVLQSVLDLQGRGFAVSVCADAVGSRRPADYTAALERLRHCGVSVTTVESALFELCKECGTAEFKSMIDLIKAPRTPDPRYCAPIRP